MIAFGEKKMETRKMERKSKHPSGLWGYQRAIRHFERHPRSTSKGVARACGIDRTTAHTAMEDWKAGFFDYDLDHEGQIIWKTLKRFDSLYETHKPRSMQVNVEKKKVEPKDAEFPEDLFADEPALQETVKIQESSDNLVSGIVIGAIVFAAGIAVGTII